MCDGGALCTDFRPDTIHSGLTGGIASLRRLVIAGDSGLRPPVVCVYTWSSKSRSARGMCTIASLTCVCEHRGSRSR